MKNPIKTFLDSKKLKQLASSLGVLAKKDVLGFGKYATLRVKDVMKKDPQYLCWIHDNTSHKLQPLVIAEARKKAAKQRLDRQESPRWFPRQRSYYPSRPSHNYLDNDECYELYGNDPVDCGPFW